VELLLALIPLVDRERCFALKGGSAINLFVRDLPRLSVDLDLTFVPVAVDRRPAKISALFQAGRAGMVIDTIARYGAIARGAVEAGQYRTDEQGETCRGCGEIETSTFWIIQRRPCMNTPKSISPFCGSLQPWSGPSSTMAGRS